MSRKASVQTPVQNSQSRRTFVRATPKTGFSVEVPRTGGGSETRDGFDIGAYGLSFLLRSEEAAAYPNGRVFSALGFDLAGRRIVVDGRVQYSKPMEEREHAGMHKIGVEFTQIESADLFYLCDIVVRESIEAPFHVKGPKMKKLLDAARKKKAKKKKAKKKSKKKPAKKKSKAKPTSAARKKSKARRAPARKEAKRRKR